MTDQPGPEDEPLPPRAMIGMLIKRNLPDRSAPSKWCGKHPKERTRLVARAKWVCSECVREASRG